MQIRKQLHALSRVDAQRSSVDARVQEMSDEVAVRNYRSDRRRGGSMRNYVPLDVDE